MQRIFLSLSIVVGIVLLTAFVLGWTIGNASSPDRDAQSRVSWHILSGLGALVIAVLAHAIVLTYFMGTGRWMEETTKAYRLSAEFHASGRSLKYGTFPGMVACIILLIATGALGAASDPASPVRFTGLFGLSGSNLHFLVATVTIAINVVVNFAEYQAIGRNSSLVEDVLNEVRRIREERGLPV